MSTQLLIRCPATDVEVPVVARVNLHSLQFQTDYEQVVRCRACRELHTWSRENAYLSLGVKPVRGTHARRGARHR